MLKKNRLVWGYFMVMNIQLNIYNYVTGNSV